MLVVGDLKGWLKAGRSLPAGPGLHFVGFDDLDARRLAEVAPDIVLSALLAPDFDVIDLALRLDELDFTGRYRAISDDIPSPGVVVAEVRQHAPGVDFDVLLIGTIGATVDIH
ncbi:hypothetical protein AADZ90_011290 [Aestuariibius sp. 2305UL40-4]|uniref:hypothetical protein n=1 Tax=Aestuariibius violaceus TaxID=3234132 RepID=UPI0034823BC1